MLCKSFDGFHTRCRITRATQDRLFISPVPACAAKKQLFLGKSYKYCMFISKLSATALLLSGDVVSSLHLERYLGWIHGYHMDSNLTSCFQHSSKLLCVTTDMRNTLLSFIDCKNKHILGLEQLFQGFCSPLTARCFSTEKNLIRETVHPYWCPDSTTLFHFPLHSAKPN